MMYWDLKAYVPMSNTIFYLLYEGNKIMLQQKFAIIIAMCVTFVHNCGISIQMNNMFEFE